MKHLAVQITKNLYSYVEWLNANGTFLFLLYKLAVIYLISLTFFGDISKILPKEVISIYRDIYFYFASEKISLILNLLISICVAIILYYRGRMIFTEVYMVYTIIKGGFSRNITHRKKANQKPPITLPFHLKLSPLIKAVISVTLLIPALLLFQNIKRSSYTIQNKPLKYGGTHTAYTPQGRFMAVANIYGKVELFEQKHGEYHHFNTINMNSDTQVTSLVLGFKGSKRTSHNLLLAAANNDGELFKFDAEGEKYKLPKMKSSSYRGRVHIAFTNKGRLVAVTENEAGEVYFLKEKYGPIEGPDGLEMVTNLVHLQDTLFVISGLQGSMHFIKMVTGKYGKIKFVITK